MLEDIGLDSMMAMDFRVRINMMFSIDLPVLEILEVSASTHWPIACSPSCTRSTATARGDRRVVSAPQPVVDSTTTWTG